ncbi:uncharacterized protein M421DRAFT_98162 [Didymella exigua CBS 183.55]|uniref:Cyclin-D1-binding protein 1-like N-terminal domain-containing protein n=1 Tax=Didymella exigua CBS 183.55 TaxID=1150837 RepID=A0A6A5S680_9PLEO|nr:uncharacterized protein M421DRAFT_98162 [Didymella exigua CBS 183.55]KAF1933007.1 hypothetical protein M421DRAFT_98162 [Didymella exigua CBS 183.55]
MTPPKDIQKLISLTQTTQTLLSHFQTSLTPPKDSNTSTDAPDLPYGPLTAIHAATTILKSHTTTLSLLLLTPPLTPSALVAKIGDVTSGALSGMVAAASYSPTSNMRDDLGQIMRGELRAQVKRLVGAWGGVLALVLAMAEARRELTGKDKGPSEAERKDVLERTGVVWDVCDELLRLCNGGVVELVLKKAQQLRAVLLDAVEELKEWGEDVADEGEEDKAEGSGDEDGFGDEDDFFGAQNKIGKDDKELKVLLDHSVKKLKMVGIMYQAIGKRRLKIFPAVAPDSNPATASPATGAANGDALTESPAQKLDRLMQILKTIPDMVDDLASTFYELEHEEAEAELKKVCDEAKSAVELVKKSWTGTDDEFTAWSGKWIKALDAA